MAFEQRIFRNALGLFPTGVAVVTTITKDGDRIGTTVSSFNSVSLSPPLVLFSIARTANSFAAWAEAKIYAINILHEHQHDVSTRFAQPLTDKWQELKPLMGKTGALLIPAALVALECESHARYDGGDHLILVGKVQALTTTTVSDPRPLVFYRGAYQKIERAQGHAPQDLSYLVHGW
jgi:flavin reductase (DIM6/NTAB) family NADH-FMN oxidoreductase RutF